MLEYGVTTQEELEDFNKYDSDSYSMAELKLVVAANMLKKHGREQFLGEVASDDKSLAYLNNYTFEERQFLLDFLTRHEGLGRQKMVTAYLKVSEFYPWL